MWPEVAQVSLILAMSLGVFQGFWSLYGAQKQHQPWINLAKPSAYLQWSLIAVAYVILTIAFIEHDFTIEYVANNSSLEQPLLYRISAVWGAHEGSLLFWAFVLASWAMLVAKFSGNIPDAFVARVLAILGLVNTGIMSFMLFTSNPFDRIPFGVSNGTELNPLL
jgi:cytochrome c-type biogenesis protein CcmF